MEVQAQQSDLKGIGLRLDRDNNPILSKDKAIELWSKLKTNDQIYFKKKYSLDLEIRNG